MKNNQPNAMWQKRPHGQLAKCAEAEALRAAFPDELGGMMTAEEMEGREIGNTEPQENIKTVKSENEVFAAKASKTIDVTPEKTPDPIHTWEGEVYDPKGNLSVIDDIQNDKQIDKAFDKLKKHLSEIPAKTDRLNFIDKNIGFITFLVDIDRGDKVNELNELARTGA